jgi:23S rRNA (cytidine1920-2'-O)/16S rRNA (cytidine1409-2'-O)-methyltransferase
LGYNAAHLSLGRRMSPVKKVRLDQLMVQRGLAESRAKAQALIMSGAVRVGGVQRDKAGDMVLPDVVVEIAEKLPFASRGGYKLSHALDAFGLSPAGLVALDAGASTGGFTDVLLQRGAAQVYAVDVGYGQLDWRLRQDPRVVVVDRTNIRYLDALPFNRRLATDDENQAADNGQQTAGLSNEQSVVLADCAVIDVSFISLKLVLPAIQRLTIASAWVVALIKPQFEAGASQVGKGGVVRDPAVHTAVLREVLAFAAAGELAPHGLVRSPITGPAGNIEFLVWLGGDGPTLDIEQAIQNVLS